MTTVMEKKRQENQSGFSLIEVMLSILILTIALLGLAQLFSFALQQNSFARYNSIGIEVAKGKLERLRAAYNNGLETGAFSADLFAGNHGPEHVTLSTPSYSGQSSRTFLVNWQVADLVGNQKHITLTVAAQTSNVRQNNLITVTSQFAP